MAAVKALDLLPGWLYALAIAALLALAGAQQVRIANAHAETAKVEREFAEARRKAAETAQKAEQEAREEEERREQRKQEIVDEAEGRIELARAAARDADAAAAGLRQRLAAYIAAVRSATADSGPAKRGETTGDPIGVLGRLFSESDDRTAALAKFADQSRIAGLACEASYDGLRAAP